MTTKVDKYLDTNIKDVMDAFPQVQKILDSFDIGCAPCSSGTCMMKDIIDIHNLNEQKERDMLTQIFEVIYPGEQVEIPRVAKAKIINNAPLSPPMVWLVNEHKLIKRLLALIPNITKVLDLSLPTHKQCVIDITDFIRNYADKYHHAKEEDILFTYFDQSVDIIQVMLNDHISGRSYVHAMLQAVDESDTEKACNNMVKYGQLLTEHIKKEDDILYPWMDRSIDTHTVGEMFAQFITVNNSMPEFQRKYEILVESFEQQFA